MCGGFPGTCVLTKAKLPKGDLSSSLEVTSLVFSRMLITDLILTLDPMCHVIKITHTAEGGQVCEAEIKERTKSIRKPTVMLPGRRNYPRDSRQKRLRQNPQYFLLNPMSLAVSKPCYSPRWSRKARLSTDPARAQTHRCSPQLPEEAVLEVQDASSMWRTSQW